MSVRYSTLCGVQMVDLAGYERRENPPGIKITAKAFGRDRRMPTTSRCGG